MKKILNKFILLFFISLFFPHIVSAATMTVGETAVLDGGSASDATYGSGSGYSESETGSGASGSSGRRGYVRPDNENESAFRQGRSSIQSQIQDILARARSASGANIGYGDLMQNGSMCTLGLVSLSEDELNNFINSANSMYTNSSMFDPSILNRYENSLSGGAYTEIPSQTRRQAEFSDGIADLGQGADVDEHGNPTNGQTGTQPSTDAPAGSVNPYNPGQTGTIYYPGVTNIGQDANFMNLGQFFQGNNIGADMSEFMNNFFRSNDLRMGTQGHGLYTLPSNWANRQLILGLDTDGNMRLESTFSRDATGIEGTTGIRNDLVNGGLNIPDSWLNRFLGLERYSNSNTTPTLALLTEYRVTGVRVNDITNVHFIPNTRYWSIDRPDGSVFNVRTEDPYLVFTPQEPGTYNFRCSQEATFTVSTTMTVTRSEYLFDTATNTILYFLEREMAPYRIGVTQQQRYLPARGYTVHVNDLNEFETTEENNRGIVERIE